MIEENAVFGGEYSNHLYFSEIYGFDDAIFAGLKMAEILSYSDKKLSQFTEEIPRYYSTTIEEIPCDDEKKFIVIEKIKQRLENENHKVLALDGVKILANEGTLLIRASNTAPVIKINSESKNPQNPKHLLDFGKKIVLEEVRKL